MNAQEWNKKLFEERMQHVNSSPPTAPFKGEVWRAVDDNKETIQVSLCGKQRNNTIERIMAGKGGIGEETLASPELVAKVFPLSEERLFA